MWARTSLLAIVAPLHCKMLQTAFASLGVNQVGHNCDKHETCLVLDTKLVYNKVFR